VLRYVEMDLTTNNLNVMMEIKSMEMDALLVVKLKVVLIAQVGQS
jgi:hypothetical protein